MVALTAALLAGVVATSSASEDSGQWVSPADFFGEAHHNGGTKERLILPAGGKKPHIWMLLFDDYGWADAGWHRDTIGPGGVQIPADPEVVTPNLNQMVKEGIELDRAYVYKYCSPTRSALQSGRNPYHVNPLNAAPNIANHSDPVSGFAAIPRNMTGIATKLSAAGCAVVAETSDRTHSFGKWDAGMATPDHTPHGRGYRTAMNYFHHDNDYWSMVVGSCSTGPPPPPGPQETCDGELFQSVCLAQSPELKATWTKDAAACCAMCSKEVECKGWAWGLTMNAEGLHACHLKSDVNPPGNSGNCTSACKYTGCLHPGNKHPVVDLWHMPEGGPEGPGHGYNNTCFTGQPNGAVNPGVCQPGPLGDHIWGGYEDSLFETQVMEVVKNHPLNPEEPFMLFWAPHIVHTPLQVPQHFLDKFSFMAATDKPTHNRQIYHAMVNFADEAVGNVTTLMKERGLWEDMIVVFSTDNGGPIYNNGSAGANNYPLKGGKMNNWEGGIRGNGFISGGFLPASRRGVKYEGLVTVWDNYATFCMLAGVDPTDHRAALAGLPPIDAISHHNMILGLNLTSPRTEIPIGTEPRASNLSTAPLCSSYSAVTVKDDPLVAGDEPLPLPVGSAAEGRCTTVSGLIVDEGSGGLWKLLTGDVQQAVYMGPHYPNSSTDEISAHFVGHCGNGCLYNIKEDPLELVDLAGKEPERLASMHKKLEQYELSAFNPHRGPTDPAACAKAMGEYGGFWGWWIE